MGARLLQEYDKAYKLGGMKARMRLAVLTNIPSQKAQDEPDSPENIAKFGKAMKELEKEFKQ